VRQTEGNIQKAILEWGRYQEGVQMFRMNVIGTPIPGRPGSYRPAPNKGMADIYCQLLVSGIPVGVWLEVKTLKGRQTQIQILFEQTVNNYYLVRSIDDAAAALDDARKKTIERLNEYLPF
jgi:hypothetical protein|tara:strand:- start:1936 stop:2298 length:363 start_codon:yes stop_codon:yes gene_type:complete